MRIVWLKTPVQFGKLSKTPRECVFLGEVDGCLYYKVVETGRYLVNIEGRLRYTKYRDLPPNIKQTLK